MENGRQDLLFSVLHCLRALRPLCEIRAIFSHKERKERRVLFPFRVSRLRWSGRKLRYDQNL